MSNNDPKLDDPRLIESPTRLSQSKLWTLQKNYFNTMGIEAWENDVPYYISNNSLIGYQYAYMVSQLIKDLKEKNELHGKVYLLEIGCGTGKFTFYFLKAITRLLEEQGLKDCFCYIISDVSEKNIQFCQENPSFSDYIKEGILDFALFDVEQDKDIFLKNANCFISSIEYASLVVISNYIFDCLKHDYLHLENNTYHGLNIGLKSRYKSFDQEQVRYLNELRFDYSLEPIAPETYFSDKILIALLQQYKAKLSDKNARLPIPLAALDFMNNMLTLTAGKVFFILGDKGITQLDYFMHLDERYRITYDGCYTFLLNFNLLADYMQQLGGDSLLTQKSNDFQVCLFSGGCALDRMPNLVKAYQMMIENVGPQEYTSLYDSAIQNGYRYSAKAVSAFLRLSHWDPDAFGLMHERLVELINVLPAHDHLNINYDLQRIENNIYHLPMGTDTNNLLGLLSEALGDQDRALMFYRRSMDIFQKSEVGYHNSGLIYDKKKEKSKALDFYRMAFKLNKHDRFAKQRIDILEGKIAATLIRPLFRLSIVIGVIVLGGLILMR